MSIISGPFLCFECSKPKKIVMTIHRLYSDKQQAQERIKKIKEIDYKNAAAIDLGDSDLGDSGIRIQEIWCYDCISHFHAASNAK
jgi:hypothetical protein